MANTRMVKTVIWEDEWFFDLSIKAQRLYLYLLTNKNTEISGMYQLPVVEMGLYTKHKPDEIKKLLKELEPKVSYIDGWVVIPNYESHQNVTNNAKVQRSIEKYKKNIPRHILNHKSEIINHKSEGIDTLSIGYQKDTKKARKTQQTKDSYGEFNKVLLTKDESAKLVDKLGKKNTDDLITELDAYIASKGKRYSSHYATLLTWARRKGLGVSDDKYKGL